MACSNPAQTPLFSLFLAARSRNHGSLCGGSPRSPSNGLGQRELRSLKNEPCAGWINLGLKSSKQAVNYERGESSAVLGPAEIRCMPWSTSAVHYGGRRGFLMTHTEKNLLVFRSWTTPKDCLRNSSHSLQEYKAQIPHQLRAPFPCSHPPVTHLGRVTLRFLPPTF